MRTRTPRSIRRLLFLVLALAATLSLARPADAATDTLQGATVGAAASTSTYTHQIYVYPYATPISGWTTQTVWYRIQTYDFMTGRSYSIGWFGPYTVTRTASTGLSCAAIVGCVTTTYGAIPQQLPGAVLSGIAGHTFDVRLQFAHATGTGYVYSDLVRIDSCQYNTYALSSCPT